MQLRFFGKEFVVHDNPRLVELWQRLMVAPGLSGPSCQQEMRDPSEEDIRAENEAFRKTEAHAALMAVNKAFPNLQRSAVAIFREAGTTTDIVRFEVKGGHLTGFTPENTPLPARPLEEHPD
jgi:hypothetical protein